MVVGRSGCCSCCIHCLQLSLVDDDHDDDDDELCSALEYLASTSLAISVIVLTHSLTHSSVAYHSKKSPRNVSLFPAGRMPTILTLPCFLLFQHIGEKKTKKKISTNSKRHGARWCIFPSFLGDYYPIHPPFKVSIYLIPFPSLTFHSLRFGYIPCPIQSNPIQS